jgi:hypothetical protein
MPEHGLEPVAQQRRISYHHTFRWLIPSRGEWHNLSAEPHLTRRRVDRCRPRRQDAP